MLIMSQIFEARAAGSVHHIFGNQALLHHPVKLAVNRCDSNGTSLILPGRCFMESVRSVEKNNEVDYAQINK